MTVELRTSSGTAYAAGLPLTVQLSSSSPTGEFSAGPDGPWAATLATAIASGTSVSSVHFRDASSGSVTITAAATGKTPATQAITIAAPAPPVEATQPLPPVSGSGGGSGPDLVTTASTAQPAPAVGTRVTYVISVKNLGGPASRAYVTAQLPSQVDYAASHTDRGPGCTGTTTLTCDLDFLAGDLVATVRIDAVVREPGTLNLTATSSSQPGDVQPANDVATVVVVVESPESRRPAAARHTLRVVGATPTVVARRGTTATMSIRFRVSGPARLQARITPLRSTRAIGLLPGTMLAGSRSTAIRPTASSTVVRGGTYDLRARVRAAGLIRGRPYLIRLTATYAAGGRRTLTIRVRA
jgi:uncharacterized repeat protein (TIGR01451 family)